MKSRPLLLILLILAVWAALMVGLASIEMRSEQSRIRSYWDAAWYSLVTLTTVGYGDVYPETLPGRAIGAVFLLGSLGVLGALVYKASERIASVRERRRMGHHGTEFQDHVVIIGWDDFARSVTTQLVNADQKVAVVTDRKDDVDLIRELYPRNTVFPVFSDLKDTAMFEKAGISRSAMVFPNLRTDTDKLISILNVRRAYPGRDFVVSLDNADLDNTFRAAGVTYVLSKGEIASKLAASFIFEPEVAEFETDLMTSAKEASDCDIQQYRVTERNPYLNRSYGEAFLDLKRTHNAISIGLSKTQAGQRKLLKLPPDDTLIELGDYLVMIVTGSHENAVARLFGVAEGVLRAG